MGRAEMRGSLVREQLRAIDDLVPQSARRIREAIAPETLARIESASRVEWVPVESLIELLRAVWSALGPQEAPRFWVRSTARIFEAPLLKTFADGVINLFMSSPAQALVLLPRLDGLLYRNTGSVSVEKTPPSGVRVIHADVPSIMLGCEPWRRSMEASYVATLDFLRARDGRVSVAELDFVRGRLVFALAWS